MGPDREVEARPTWTTPPVEPHSLLDHVPTWVRASIVLLGLAAFYAYRGMTEEDAREAFNNWLAGLLMVYLLGGLLVVLAVRFVWRWWRARKTGPARTGRAR